jgi:hypothetical protein
MLVIHGRKVAVPTLESTSFLDDPKLGFTNPKDYGFRTTTWIRSICLHTRMGVWPQTLVDTASDRHWDTIGVKNASGDDRIASWHVSIDADGSFVCHLDIGKHKAYHASQCNDVSIGIEMYQEADGTITEKTIDACVKIVDVLTREFKIQRQYATSRVLDRRFATASQAPPNKPENLAFMAKGESGETFVGVFGHRNATSNRGLGDPGDIIFSRLRASGYEPFAADTDADLTAWKIRQKNLGMLAPHDGIAGPGTVATLLAKGRPHGLWVVRPGD